MTLAFSLLLHLVAAVAGAAARALVGAAGVPGPGAGAGRRVRLGRGAAGPPSPAAARSARRRRGCPRWTSTSRCGWTRSSLTLAALVTGVGALVLLYCARYFEPDDEGIGRFAGNLTAFAGSMLGLVLADDLLLLYVFWELTTVFSFLLIGGSGTRLAARRAASQALILTTAGGLAMLVGLIMIGESSGSYLLSEVVADPGSGPFLVARHRAGAGRGDHQVGDGALPLLAARRDGGADAGQRLPARRGDGEGRHLPGRAARPGLRRRPRLAADRARPGPGHHAGRRLPRAAAERPQAAAGLRHRQPARLPHGAGRRRQPGARRGRAGDARRARAVQVHALPHRRRHRPRHRHPRPAPAVRAGPPAARARRHRRAGRRVDGRPAAAARASSARRRRSPRSGTAGCPTAPPPPLVLAGLVLGSALTAGVHRSASCGAPSPASPGCADTEPAELVHPPGPLFLAAPARARAGRACSPGRPARCSSRWSPATPTRCRWSRRRPRSSALWHGLQPALALSALTLLGGAALFAVRAPGQPVPAAASPSAPRPTRATGTRCRAWTASPCWSPAPPSAARCRPTSARSSSSCSPCPARCCCSARRGRGSGGPGTPRSRRWSARSC